MTDYKAIQEAASDFCAEVMRLPKDERMGWVSYFLEGLEADEASPEILLDVQRLIEQRFENDGW